MSDKAHQRQTKLSSLNKRKCVRQSILVLDKSKHVR